MEIKEFAIALSEKDGEEAIREASLKIKLTFPKQINHLILLFTPQYNPASILKSVNLTLKPKTVLGLQSPFLIFEEKVIAKGIIACCINKEGVELEELSLESSDPQEIETFLASSFRKLKGKEFHLFSLLSPKIDPYTYTNKMRLSVGRVFNLLGIGYTKKQSPYNSQIVNNDLSEGLVNMIMKGPKMHYLKSRGYLPLGKPFTITKATADRRIIIEINGQPAIDIYKYYLEEKFDIFVKNRLFSLYPLEIIVDERPRLINIIDQLEDGSLVCLGEVKEKAKGHIMLLDPNLLLENVKSELKNIKDKEEGLVFMVNSLTRKKILKDHYKEEIKLTKQILGDKFKVIGLYSDYSFFSGESEGEIDIEAGDLLITLWQ